MTNKVIVLGLIVCALLAAVACGQDGAAAPKGLKDAYAGKFLIGTAGDIPRGYSEVELANIKANYDIVTPENCMKPQPTHPSEDTYNFTTPDAMVDWCMENGVKVWGHTLGWHSQTANWFFVDESAEAEDAAAPPSPADPQTPPAGNRRGARGARGTRGGAGGPAGFGGGFGGFGRGAASGPPASRELALQRLKDHIMTVVGRYKGRITGWDVFNESIADGGDGSTENLRTNSWYRVVGPDVLTMAFKWAHEADPDAQLYYNDYNIDQGAVANTGKHASSLLLLKRLIAEGAPITGVGIQGHWHLDTNLADVEKAIENYAALGLRVAITELDVTSTGGNSGAFGRQGGSATLPPEANEQQAEVYRKLFEIFRRHEDVIDRVTFWGISDNRSWRRGQYALVYDGDLKPKPSYKAIMEVGMAEEVPQN